MAVKYLSNKVKDLQVGITNYSENKSKSLYVVGNVGVGTNDPTNPVGVGNTSVLAVGILTAYKIFSSIYGEFEGSTVVAGNITGVGLSISGISTLGDVKISSGIITHKSGPAYAVTYYGDGQYLTGITTSTADTFFAKQLFVSGVSTFKQDIHFPGAAYNVLWDQATSKFKFDDNAQLVFGSASGGDMKLFHQSGNSTIRNETGQFRIAGNDIRLQTQNHSEDYLLAVDGGSVSIFHNDVKRLETTASGVDITDTLNVAGVSTFTGAIDANGSLDVDGQTDLDDLVVTGVSTFNNTVTLSSLLDCNGGADIDTLTAATAKISDLTQNRIVIAGVSGELLDNANLTYTSSTLTVGTNLDVDGHTELDDVNVGGAITATTFTGNLVGNLTGTINTASQPNINSVGTLSGLSVSGSGLQVQNAASGVALDVTGYTELDTVSVASTSTFVGHATFGGNVSIAGTVTYDDVTNVDSIGLITARSGVRITGGGIDVSSGVSTFVGFATFKDGAAFSGSAGDYGVDFYIPAWFKNNIPLYFGGNPHNEGGNGGDSHLQINGNSDGNSYISVGGNSNPNTDSLTIRANNLYVEAQPPQAHDRIITVTAGAGVSISGVSTFTGDINANGNIIGDAATNISGINSVTAVKYYGDGSELINVGGTGLWVSNSAGIHTTVDVGIGTTNPSAAVTSANTNKLAVGIVSTYNLYAKDVNVSGASTLTGDTFVGSAITMYASTGIVSATSFYGEGSNLTDVSWGSSQGGSFITEGSQTAVGGDPGDWQVIAGFYAGCCANTNTHNNVIFGKSAGRKLVDGERNVLIGDEVGCGLTTGMRNIFMGADVAKESTTGDYNIGLGYKTLRTSTGSCNIAIGFCAADGNTSGTNNVIIGKNANSDVGVGGTDNVWIGTDSGGYASGCCNTFVGAQSGYGVYNGTFNVGLGYQAGKSVIQQTAHYNVSIGAKAGCLGTTGSCNVFLGLCAGRAVSTGDFNLFAGHKAGDAVTVGACNVYLGNLAGAGSTAGERNIAVGQCAGYSNKIGTNNVSIGSSAGYSNETGTDNVFIGKYAGRLSTASNNVILGSSSGSNLTSGSSNVFLGSDAGLQATTAHGNIFLGLSAGQGDSGQPIIGGCNTAIGWMAGKGIKDGEHNVFLGTKAGICNDDGKCNVFLGYYAGQKNTDGFSNVFLGYNTGCDNVSGSCNIAIGHEVNVPLANGNHQLAIGRGTDRWITGDSSYNVTLAGIATVTKSTGVFEATKFCGDGSCLTNLPSTGGGGLWVSNSAGIHTTVDVGIGTTNPSAAVTSANTNKLAVGIVSTYQLYSENINVSGISTFDGNVNIDGDIVLDTPHVLGFGPNNSCGYIYHSSSNLMLTNVVGDVYLTTSDNDKDIIIRTDDGSGGTTNYFLADGSTGEAILYHYGTERIKTSSSGAIVTGVLTATSFSGDGSALTGISAGFSPDAQENLYAGTDAGKCSGSDNCYNVAIGYHAGCEIGNGGSTQGDENVFIGKNSGRLNSAGLTNTFLGSNSGCRNSSGHDNVAIGNNALSNVQTGNANVAVGKNAGGSTTGYCNTFLGYYAGRNNTSGCCNIAIGRAVCLPSATTNNQFAIGSGTCHWITGDANFNVGIGTNRHDTIVGSAVTAKLSVGIVSAYQLYGHLQDDVNYNVFAGTDAGKCAGTSNSYNVAIGYKAGCKTGTSSAQGYGNVLIGKCAGASNTSGHNNTFLGPYAACANSGGMENVSIGYYSMPYSSGNYNTALGRQAGCKNTGNCNTFIGNLAGKNMTSAKCSVALGLDFEFPSITEDNQLLIASKSIHWIYGNGDGNIGIGTDYPNAAVGVGNTAKLSVGILSAYMLYGDGSNLTNVGGGTLISGITVKEEGTTVGTAGEITTLDFEGSSVTATASGATATIAVTSGINTGGTSTFEDLTVNGQATFTGLSTFVGIATFQSVDINNGAIDGTNIGFNHRANGQFVNLDATGTLGVDGVTTLNHFSVTGVSTFAGTVDVNGYLDIGGNAKIAGVTTFYSTLDSAGSTQGSVVMHGGLGVSKQVNLGDGLNVIGHTEVDNLNVSGVSTFAGDINANGNIIGDGSTKISGISSLTIASELSHTGDTGTKLSFGTGVMSLVSEGNTLFNVGNLLGGTQVNEHLLVSGNARVTGILTASDFNSTSDIRLKTNIKRIEDPLDKVIRIEGVTFDWKEWNKPALGVIADQVEEVIPELVQGTDPKTVNYNGLIGLLIEAVKEQQTQIDDLKSRLSKLE